VFNRTLSSLEISCTPTYDGGSLATYALELRSADTYAVLFNQSAPLFSVKQLSENTNYTFRVCASNYEYWMNRNCTADFVGRTVMRYGKS